jgi:hypothetical protein
VQVGTKDIDVALRPAERLPPGGPPGTALAFTVVFGENQPPASWRNEPRAYWVSFKNVFGETFTTANPHDPCQSAAFMRVEELPSPEVG